MTTLIDFLTLTTMGICLLALGMISDQALREWLAERRDRKAFR